MIRAETGGDVGRFPDEKHFASWLGLCPRTARSNKTEKRRTSRKGKGRVAQALRMAAQAVGRAQTALGAFYRRIKGRLGGRGAITATAHKLSRLVYRLLKVGTEYVTQSLAGYEPQVREKLERGLRRKARSLGYELVPAASPRHDRSGRRHGVPTQARPPGAIRLPPGVVVLGGSRQYQIDRTQPHSSLNRPSDEFTGRHPGYRRSSLAEQGGEHTHGGPPR